MSEVEEKEVRLRIRSDCENAMLLVRSDGAWLPTTLATSEAALGRISCETMEDAYPPYALRLELPTPLVWNGPPAPEKVGRPEEYVACDFSD